MREFSEIRATVIKKISKSENYVTSSTNYTGSGVYLLYIDYFESDKIIPIYVGQAINVQKRYKEHISKLLALNHFSYEYYHDSFYSNSSSRYEGSFSVCKIFKFMVDNELSSDRLSMIILEECEPELLDKFEQRYIDNYKSVFLGFNQLNSFNFALKNSRQYPATQVTLDQYTSLAMEDMNNLKLFQDYGYTRFNLNHAFHLQFENELKKNEKYSSFLKEYSLFIKKYFLIYQDLAYIKLLNTYKGYNERRSNISKEEQKEYYALSDLYEALNDKTKKQLNDYDIMHFAEEVRQYKKSKELGIRVSKKWYKNGKNHFINLDKLHDELEELESSYGSDPCKDLSLIEENYRKQRYKDIFPKKYNSRFPLSSHEPPKYSSLKVNLVDEILDNVFFVEFIFSSNTRKFANYTEPFLFLINTTHREGDRIISRNYYLKNVNSIVLQNTERYDFYEFEDVRPYLDLVFFPNMFGSRNNFDPIAYDPNIEQAYPSVSINTEFNTGYSNFDIINNELVDPKLVFSMLNEKWLSGMNIIIRSSEGPKTYSKVLKEYLSKLNIEIANIILSKKPVKGLVNIKQKKAREKEKIQKVKSVEKGKVSRSDQHSIKLVERFGDNVILIDYQGSGKESTYQCSGCGYVWSRRSDRIFARPNCPSCKMRFTKI